jgi:hypothetical protein
MIAQSLGVHYIFVNFAVILGNEILLIISEHDNDRHLEDFCHPVRKFKWNLVSN